MTPYHATLTQERWQEFSLVEQLANIGSEVERAIRWREKGNAAYSRRAFERALELLCLTKSDPRHRGRLRELSRLHEALADYFVGSNEFGSTDLSWRRYFDAFAFAARRDR